MVDFTLMSRLGNRAGHAGWATLGEVKQFLGDAGMWDEITVQLLYKDHGKGGVAPRRHEIARQAYSEKVRARHEAEQRAATTGAVMKAMSWLWELTSVMFAPMQSPDAPARRTGAEYPAE